MKMKILAFLIYCVAFTPFTHAETSQKLQIIGSEGSTSIRDLMEPGKWTVVMIWASDCHVCNQEASKYISFHNEHANKDAKIIGMSLDGTQEAAIDFVSRHKLNYPNLVGSVEDIATFYGSETGEAFRATPTFMVYGPNGELKAAQPGGIPPKVIEDFMARSVAG